MIFRDGVNDWSKCILFIEILTLCLSAFVGGAICPCEVGDGHSHFLLEQNCVVGSWPPKLLLLNSRNLLSKSHKEPTYLTDKLVGILVAKSS